jgi:hypothetical protein
VLHIACLFVMQEPPDDLCRLSSLKTLSITSCRMKTVDSAQLHMLPSLEVLDLSSNSLTGEYTAACNSGSASVIAAVVLCLSQRGCGCT